MVQEKTPKTTSKTTAETTHHIRFQLRKPYVKAIKTNGAGLASQQKDRNNVVTITTYNDDTKEQRLEGVGDLVKVTPAKNASSNKTKVEVLHDKTKQDKLKVGDNISISEDSTISAVDTKYQAGDGLKLTGTTFSIDKNQDYAKNIVAERLGGTIVYLSVTPYAKVVKAIARTSKEDKNTLYNVIESASPLYEIPLNAVMIVAKPADEDDVKNAIITGAFPSKFLPRTISNFFKNSEKETGEI